MFLTLFLFKQKQDSALKSPGSCLEVVGCTLDPLKAVARSCVIVREQESAYYLLHPSFISLKAILKNTQGTMHNPISFTFSKEKERGGLKGC